MRNQFIAIALMLLTLSACEPASSPAPESVAMEEGVVRWYSAAQVDQGEAVFTQNCAVCHGQQAEGTVADWRARLDDGSFPPPPLNGTAHAWHHPRSVLLQVINNGGIPLGGKMPGFTSVLEDEEKLAAIAYFQDFWSDDIYADWQDMGGVN